MATDIAFSPAVRAVQTARGSRDAYAAMEMGTRITPDLAAYIAARDSAYLATASADGQPYVQHRGGPPGFIRVVDDTTLAFADYRGNRQYITTGNLSENPRAYLFLMDYAARRRIKLWGAARVETDPDLIARLMPADYRARPEQALVFQVAAWDANCPQHIPHLVPAALLAARDARIAELEAALAAARGDPVP